jgi:hypothetical protein
MQDDADEAMPSSRWFIIATAFVIVAWLLWPLGAYHLAKIYGLSEDKLGEFGDIFGGINALATAAALAAIWWTGRMQQSELRLQRRELKAQREELQETRAVFAKQTFEATFFQVLKNLRADPGRI